MHHGVPVSRQHQHFELIQSSSANTIDKINRRRNFKMHVRIQAKKYVAGVAAALLDEDPLLVPESVSGLMNRVILLALFGLVDFFIAVFVFFGGYF